MAGEGAKQTSQESCERRSQIGDQPNHAQPMRVIEVSMEQRRNERLGETGDPRENHRPTASSGTIPTCENPELPGRKLNPNRFASSSGQTTIRARTINEFLAPKIISSVCANVLNGNGRLARKRACGAPPCAVVATVENRSQSLGRAGRVFAHARKVFKGGEVGLGRGGRVVIGTSFPYSGSTPPPPERLWKITCQTSSRDEGAALVAAALWRGSQKLLSRAHALQRTLRDAQCTRNCRFGQLLTSRSSKPMRVKRRTYGPSPEFKGERNGRSPRKLPDQRDRPARFPHVKIRGRTRRGLSPVHLVGRRVV
ncbi:hypothetical protein PR048_007878 [Dryococelus australis]|uniref:Uncharacterized protein n=1 Tax=Dryococelus australis TaxID=614101 RepID=A0ABQ9HVH4_9NEOP|nr:hypothetical protein PR048_007878 [Dryococelus australis]